MTVKWLTEPRSASRFRGKIIGRHSTLTNKKFVRGDASAKTFLKDKSLENIVFSRLSVVRVKGLKPSPRNPD